MTSERRATLSRMLRITGQDMRWGVRHLWVNAIGGWFLMPRLVRFAVYRSAGLELNTANIFDGCRFRGSAPVSIGSGTFVNRECYFEAAAPIRIGRECHLAMQVMIMTSTHPIDGHTPEPGSAHFAPVTIGDRCWLGARSTVLPGVRIGDGVVIAAGAVVTKHCAPHGVYAGTPAVRVRELVGRESDRGSATP